MAFIVPAGTGYTLADAAAARFLAKSGTTIIASAFSAPVNVILGSDQTTTSTSYADITGLSFSVAASTNYFFMAWLIYRSSDVNEGPGFSVNGPASPTLIKYYNFIPQSAAGAVTRSGRDYDIGAVATTTDVADSDVLAYVEGYLRNGSNAGTLALRFRTDVAATITVKAGSVLTYQEVA